MLGSLLDFLDPRVEMSDQVEVDGGEGVGCCSVCGTEEGGKEGRKEVSERERERGKE